jgi:hypothetical protein
MTVFYDTIYDALSFLHAIQQLLNALGQHWWKFLLLFAVFVLFLYKLYRRFVVNPAQNQVPN